jgi:polysaccharide export outer membrane protein
MRRIVLVLSVLLGCAWSAVPAQGAKPESTAATPVVESLTWDNSAGTLTIFVKTGAPVPPFTCRWPGGSTREVVVEVPGATHRLQSRYTIDSSLVGSVAVEATTASPTGTRVRVSLRDGVLQAVDQVSHGVVLRIEAGEPGAPQSSWSSLEEYRVGPGDKIEISVFGHPDLNKIVEVRGDGSINYPLLGDLPVAGKTVSEIDADLTRRLAKDFLVDPQISVDVREYQSQWVTVMGEVRTPGRYVLKRNMRLVDLLAEAGGATKEAGREIRVTRRADDRGGTRLLTVSREQLLSANDPSANIVLAHGDIVAVAEQEVFYIRGEIAKPGSYYLADGMTIMKAVAVAGGLSQFANRKDIELLRAGPGGVSKKVIVNLKAIEDGKKQDIPLLPNDTVIVPRRIF